MPERTPPAGPQDEQSCGLAETPRQKRTSRATVPALCPPPRLLGLEDAGAYLGCTYWTARNLVEAGTIPAVRIPGLRRKLVDVRDLDRLIDQWKESA